MCTTTGVETDSNMTNTRLKELRGETGECIVDDPVPLEGMVIRSVSLGSGDFSVSGSISFSPSSRSLVASLRSSTSEPSPPTNDDVKEIIELKTPVTFRRSSSSFMRTSDLGLDSSLNVSDDEGEEIHPHYHHPSQEPPPGVTHDPKETWIALDNGYGSHAPIAPYAVEALTRNGLKTAMNSKMWTPNRPTEKLLRDGGVWADIVWKDDKISIPDKGSSHENDVLVWSGTFDHGFYGSDLPAVRAEGIVNMSPLAIAKLLLDSSRVKEYNKMSVGREDILVLQDDLDNEGPFGKSITKVVRNRSKPPMMRKVLEFVTLMHLKELPNGNGYILVSRAVTPSDEESGAEKVVRSEILTGVNLFRSVDGDENRTLMTTVNHLYSPMVPMMIAKKIGLSSASGFFYDMRALC